MLDHTQKITCHKNLRRNQWVMSQASASGRITTGKDYADSLTLRDVTFHVTESSRQRVCRLRSRDVHAWCVGTVAEAPAGKVWREVTYNPFRAPLFHYRDGSPVHSAAFVHFAADGKAYAAR